MANKEEIIVKIDGNGKIVAETFGFEGPTCAEELDKLMKGLANHVRSTKKAEFFKSRVKAEKRVKIQR